ncbi:hypothetical protein MIND_00678500 [Mycena indigotica]|uniref:non-specific serine/threonine protein kinase n=1 Tax=Mycena indigotica TaxID=2126181 RepID=A0A8H6W340_9AGAR|nr:uncharacterized protein MIND_00678500 [Mycena indigotica]KAF7301141.1 hypothetical protein MIND_00678500 [Mycena indigotica]
MRVHIFESRGIPQGVPYEHLTTGSADADILLTDLLKNTHLQPSQHSIAAFQHKQFDFTWQWSTKSVAQITGPLDNHSGTGLELLLMPLRRWVPSDVPDDVMLFIVLSAPETPIERRIAFAPTPSQRANKQSLIFECQQDEQLRLLNGTWVPLDAEETTIDSRFDCLPAVFYHEAFLNYAMKLDELHSLSEGELNDKLREVESLSNKPHMTLQEAETLLTALTCTYLDEVQMQAALQPLVRRYFGPKILPIDTKTNLKMSISEALDADVDDIGRVNGHLIVKVDEYKTRAVPSLQGVLGSQKHSVEPILLEQEWAKEYPTAFLRKFYPILVTSYHGSNITPLISLRKGDQWFSHPLGHSFDPLKYGFSSIKRNDTVLKRLALFFGYCYLLCLDIEKICSAETTPPPVAPQIFPADHDDGGFLSHSNVPDPKVPQIMIADWTRNNSSSDNRTLTVVLKFVSSRYGTKAHMLAQGLGLAPALIHFGPVPGSLGYHVVVMEYVSGIAPDKRHVTALENAIKQLDENQLVHGDLRLPNIIFLEDGSLKIIDWDWATAADEPSIKYPDNLDTTQEFWVGKAGKTITAEDDINMLKGLVEKLGGSKRRAEEEAGPDKVKRMQTVA